MSDLEHLYVCSVYLNGTRVIILSNNDDGQIVPLVYRELEFNKNRKDIEEKIQMMADKFNMTVEIAKYQEIEIVKVLAAQNILTH